ncbi:MAG: FHA domain-containing protein [Gammaproteobacteria bacterium]
MSFLNVYFNNRLKAKHEVKSLITRIGRDSDNDVVIDNAGVSGHHAEIVKDGIRYTIYDLNSTNGVFVNGERISDIELKFGDEISIFKHTLRFLDADLPLEIDEEESRLSGGSQAATVEVDVSNLQYLLKNNALNMAFLEVLNGDMADRKLQIKGTRFSIGKSSECDFQIKGWFAPKVAARILRQSDGYYLVPEKRGNTKINGVKVKCRVRLRHDSNLEVRGTVFHFISKI